MTDFDSIRETAWGAVMRSVLFSEVVTKYKRWLNNPNVRQMSVEKFAPAGILQYLCNREKQKNNHTQLSHVRSYL